MSAGQFGRQAGQLPGAIGAGSEDLPPQKRTIRVKIENSRFGAIFGRVWPQLGQNRTQREKLSI